MWNDYGTQSQSRPPSRFWAWALGLAIGALWLASMAVGLVDWVLR